jgi:DmsE family decaheme c-type cytochrome
MSTLRTRRVLLGIVLAIVCVTGLSPMRAAAQAVGPAQLPPAASNSPTALGYSAKGADTCLACHGMDAKVTAIFRSPHAQPGNPRSPFGHGGLQCEACHGPGGAHVKAMGMKPAGIVVFGARSPTPVLRQNAMCLSCHRSTVGHVWRLSAHAQNQVSCADCHHLHGASDPVRAPATQAAVCAKCHAGVVAQFRKPYHHPVPDGTMSCASCHDPHGSLGPAMLVKETVNETCTSCHARMRGPFLWEHQPVSDNCLDCHAPHGSVVAALLTEQPTILCQQCHDAAGHPSVPYGPQGLPGGMPNPYLLLGGCVNCHSRIHGSNSPSGQALMR